MEMMKESHDLELTTCQVPHTLKSMPLIPDPGASAFAFLGAKPVRVLDFHPPQQGLDFVLKSSTKVFAVKFVKVIFKWDNDLK